MTRPAKAPKPSPTSKLLTRPGRTETGVVAFSMMPTWSPPSTTWETLTSLEIIGEAIVESLLSLDLALQTIELRELLAEI